MNFDTSGPFVNLSFHIYFVFTWADSSENSEVHLPPFAGEWCTHTQLADVVVPQGWDGGPSSSSTYCVLPAVDVSFLGVSSAQSGQPEGQEGGNGSSKQL